MENLRYLLYPYHPETPIYFGCEFRMRRKVGALLYTGIKIYYTIFCVHLDIPGDCDVYVWRSWLCIE